MIMREHLYRGIREDNREFVYGWYAPLVCNDKTIIPNIRDKNGSDWKVIPETVGQYTCLTDKNVKMIFEGDIVRYGDTIHEVVFEQRNGTAYFGLVYSKTETLSFGHYQDLKQIEVIGNIYENPGLLKGE